VDICCFVFEAMCHCDILFARFLPLQSHTVHELILLTISVPDNYLYKERVTKNY